MVFPMCQITLESMSRTGKQPIIILTPSLGQIVNNRQGHRIIQTIP